MTEEKSKVYFVKFENKETMEKFASAPPTGAKVRCIYKTKNMLSVEANKQGFFKIISEGYLPDEITK